MSTPKATYSRKNKSRNPPNSKRNKVLAEEKKLLKELTMIENYQKQLRTLSLQLQVEEMHMEGLLNPQPVPEVPQKEAAKPNEDDNIDVPSIVNTAKLDLTVLSRVNDFMQGNYRPQDEEEEEESD